MANAKRPWGVVAGPVLLVVGLGLFWGGRTAVAVKDTVQDWGDRIEHSAAPVRMEMPSMPFFPPLYVNGKRIGRVESVTVLRNRPAAVDSLRVVASTVGEGLAGLGSCPAIRLRFMSSGSTEYSRALRCVTDTEGLVPFGELRFEGGDSSVPILVRIGELPCREGSISMGPCDEVSADVRAELENLQRELRVSVGRMHVEVTRDRERTSRVRVHVP